MRRLPQAMRKQVGDSGEDFPVSRSVSQAPIEANIQDENFVWGVAQGPEIADRVALKEGLREVPNLPGERETPRKRVRDGEGLTELCTVHRFLNQLSNERIGIVVKALHVGTGQKKKRIEGTSNIEFGGATVEDTMKIAGREGRLGLFAAVQDSLRAHKDIGEAIVSRAVHGKARKGFDGSQ